MASSSSIVIKVKYGEALRRFKAAIFDNYLLIDVAMLKEKIRSFFSFDSGAEFTMTYVDEDNDVVIIADDDDLHDIVGQFLNPLRITVKLNNGNPTGSTGTSAPVSLSQRQLPHHPFNSEVSQTMKLPLYQPRSQTWNPAAPMTPKSPLLNPACWNPVVPKTPTLPLIQPQSQPLNPTVHRTPRPPVQPQFLQSNPAILPKPRTRAFYKTPMSQIIKPELQTSNPVESETLKSQLIKSQSQTLNTGAKPKNPGVAELMEKMKVTGLNQLPETGISLPQVTGGRSNVTGHQDVNSESSTVINTKVSVNSDIGNFNMMDKQPPKVTEDVKFKDVQPLRFVDQKFPDYQFQPLKETTNGVKDGKKVEVNHEARSLFSHNDHVYARCNSCGIITTAPWFKSKVKENYNLCCTCFAELPGSFTDYFIMDKHTIAREAFNKSDANWKNFDENLDISFMPPVVKNPEVANQDHPMNTILPGKNIIKVSDSEGSNVDSPHKDQEKNKYSTVDNGDVSSTMATTLTDPAGPAESESTMNSPPVGPTVRLGTTSVDPVSFPTAPPMVSDASSSTVAVAQSSSTASQNSSDEWEEVLDHDKTLQDGLRDWLNMEPIASQNSGDEWEEVLDPY